MMEGLTNMLDGPVPLSLDSAPAQEDSERTKYQASVTPTKGLWISRGALGTAQEALYRDARLETQGSSSPRDIKTANQMCMASWTKEETHGRRREKSQEGAI